MIEIDRTGEKCAFAELPAFKSWFGQVLDLVDYCVLVVDVHGQPIYQNAETARAFASGRLSMRDVLNEVLPRLGALSAASCDVQSNGNVVFLGKRGIPFTLRSGARKSRSQVFDATFLPLTGSTNDIAAVLITIEARQRHSATLQALRYQANHDELTGLVNRRVFKDRLRRLASAGAPGEHTLLFMDLDKFKLVNDRVGHKAGDEVLKQAVSVLGKSLRSRDTLARLGGDEFGVLMEYCSESQAAHVARQLSDAIRAHEFSWNGHVFSLGISIGMVSITPGCKDVEALIAAADLACYRSKSAGGSCVTTPSRSFSDDADCPESSALAS